MPERLRLRLALSDGVSSVTGDESQLRVMIGNLLANAVEALGLGTGEVVLRTLPPASTKIGCLSEFDPVCFDWNSADLKTSAACLEVRDTGPGIVPEIQSRLFDPFFSTKPGNRGLGLSTVLGIVRAHRGGIQVLSASDRGINRARLSACPHGCGRPHAGKGRGNSDGGK